MRMHVGGNVFEQESSVSIKCAFGTLELWYLLTTFQALNELGLVKKINVMRPLKDLVETMTFSVIFMTNKRESNSQSPRVVERCNIIRVVTAIPC